MVAHFLNQEVAPYFSLNQRVHLALADASWKTTIGTGNM